MKKKKGYLHGYSQKERNRLYKQAVFLEPWVYENVDLKKYYPYGEEATS